MVERYPTGSGRSRVERAEEFKRAEDLGSGLVRDVVEVESLVCEEEGVVLVAVRVLLEQRSVAVLGLVLAAELVQALG